MRRVSLKSFKPLNAEAPRRREKSKTEKPKDFHFHRFKQRQNQIKNQEIFAFFCAPLRLCASALRGFAFFSKPLNQ